MRTWYHSWRAAIRIARRDALRAKGRSSLVLAMIALPIVGVSAADLTFRSSQLSPEQQLARDIGQADARLTDPLMGGVPLLQSPGNEYSSPEGDYENKPYPDGSTDVAKAVPQDARTLSDSLERAKLRTEHGLLNTEIRELKAADSMVKGMMPLTGGRFPQKDHEVAATDYFLENSGLKVGSKLTARNLDREYTIVGSYELPGSLKTDQVNALPGALLAPLDKALDKAGLRPTHPDTSYLVEVEGGFTWNMVKEANAKGVTVDSRAVIMNPPADSEVPLFQKEDAQNYGLSPAADNATLAVIGTVVLLALLEICLLAGPAFAVGARRSRRQLGLVGANGGDRRHIRAIVLAGGLVIGIAAAVVGTLLGLLLTYALRPVLEDLVGERFGHFDVRPLELGAIALLAVVTGLLAALVPAISTSRQPVLASLTGRLGVRKSNRVLPVLGLIAVALGVAIALYGSLMSDQFLIVAGGSALAELGVVALTPALVGLFGRLGRFLPLAPRLALRDAVRNRGRTAPAVAAVLAAVAGTVAVATFAASDDAEIRSYYEARLPHGAVALGVDEAGGAREVPGLRSAVEKAFPVGVRADVDRLLVGDPGCTTYDGYGSDNPECGRYELITPRANECPLWVSDPKNPEADPADRFSKAERRKLTEDWRCKNTLGGGYAPLDVVVGDAKVLKVLGIEDAGAEKALADGKALVFDKRYAHGEDKLRIRMVTDLKAADKAQSKGGTAPGEVKSFAMHRMEGGGQSYGVPVIMPPDAAEAAEVNTLPYGAYYSTDRMPSSEERQRLDSELSKTGVQADLHIEEGYQSSNNVMMLALAVFAGLITIGAAGIATGLSQADAEADLKTLAAVGAPPRVRRTLSGFQCGVVATMGVVLGSAAGMLPSVGLRLSERRSEMQWFEDALAQGHGSIDDKPFVPIVVPWTTLALLLVAVPLGAALLAALVTRSRGALARRAAS
ncbi:FtsX-like permease family protein [Streptomyces jumonjinensis]|uniref:ABC transporter permease n=1 Tax=Streptomyces jumonjinensis TaxID=1945 RepID=A0A646KRN6_STRJU|nr:FtsX-like permease family protein [Streptomyces jumonjinensis]MQT04999.1 ABC transporter permease [Streptomyces jumonjinensis]